MDSTGSKAYNCVSTQKKLKLKLHMGGVTLVRHGSIVYCLQVEGLKVGHFQTMSESTESTVLYMYTFV